MIIFVDNLKVRARHGVLQQERVVGADFIVSLRAECGVTAAATDNDQMEGTVSYADLAYIIKEEMDIPSRLLEHVATRIARTVLARHQMVREVWVRVTKCNPPLGLQTSGAGVELTLNRV